MNHKRRRIVSQKVPQALVPHPHPAKIRNFHIRAYKTQLTSLHQATEKMRRYKEVDQPAFSLWWQKEFSDLLDVQVKLEKRLGDLQLLIDAVEHYKTHYQCNWKRAFNVVSKAQSTGKLGELMQKIFAEIDQARQKKPKEKPFPFAEEIFEPHASAPVEKVTAPSPEETTEAYIKKIYRDLVRQLHPDAGNGAEQTAEDRALWFELQNAYEWRDLDRMEGIFRAVNGQARAAIDFASIPIGDIFAMKEAVARKLDQLRREMKLAKKEANWDFENRRKKPGFLSSMGQAIQSELVGQSKRMENQIIKLQKKIQNWTSPPKNQKQTSSK